MKSILLFLIGAYLLFLPACSDTEEVSLSYTLAGQTQKTTVPSYAQECSEKALGIILTPSGMNSDSLGVDEFLGVFCQEIQQGQMRWHEPDQYQRWYENRLASSCAYTRVDQQAEYTTILWDYNSVICNRQDSPQVGQCRLKVYQQRNILHATITYTDLALDGNILTGRHSFQWEMMPSGSLQLFHESLQLDGL